MENSLAAGRRLALRVIVLQVIVALVVGLGLLTRGTWSGVAALAGGLLVAIGTAILAARVFVTAPATSGKTVARFAVGTLLKWVVTLVGLYLIIVVWKLPPLPAFIGLFAALLVNLVALKFER